MIRIGLDNPEFYTAYLGALKALPVTDRPESPRSYNRRWHEAYGCRVDPNPHAGGTFYIFDQDEDYTWFMLKFA